MTKRTDTITKFKIIQLAVSFWAVLGGYLSTLVPAYHDSAVMYLADLVTLAYILYAFFTADSKKRFYFRNHETVLVMAVLLLAILVNYKNSDIYSILRVAEMFPLLMGGMVYSGKEDMTKIRKFIHVSLWIIAGLTFILSVGSIGRGIIGTFFPQMIGTETAEIWAKDLTNFAFGGLYDNGNRLGIAAFMSMMASGCLIADNGKGRIFHIFNLVFELVVLLVSGARGVLIGAMITGLVVCLKAGRKYRRIFIIVLLIGIVGLVYTTLYKMTMYHGESSVELLLNQLSGNRYEIWQEGLRMFRDHLWFGVGPDNIPETAASLAERYSLIASRHYETAHNAVITLLATTGLIGLLGFLPLVRTSVHSLKHLPTVFTAFLLGLFVADLFDMYMLYMVTAAAFVFPLLIGYGKELGLREEKQVYFFSNVMDEDLFAETYTKKEKPGQQSQKFNRLIAQGFAMNGKKIKCCTAVLASKSIVDYTFHRFRNEGMYHYSLSINIPGIKNLYHFFSAFFMMLGAEDGYCIVDPLSIDNGMGAILACRLRGMPVAGIVTDLPEHFVGDGIYAKLSYTAFALCDGYVFLTKQMDELLNPKHKPWILMEGLCDINVHKEEIDHRNKAIIFAGELDEANGVVTLIDAFNQWKQDTYDLYYYGSGEAEETLKEKSKDNPHIHLMGLVLNRELLPVMNAASLLVNPRPVDQEFTKYSFPSKLIEYMNTGTFTASSRLVCIPEDYFGYMGDLGSGYPEDILKFFHMFEKMSEEEMRERGKASQAFILREKNNRAQAERMYRLMEEIYEK